MTDGHADGDAQDDSLDEFLAASEALRRSLEAIHMPDFLGIDVTMAQAKILLVVASAGELHMAELVRRLRVSLSTISGHVDRLVDQGFLARRADPADRRQVLVAPTSSALELAERFRAMNVTHLRHLFAHMSIEERRDVTRSFGHLVRAVERAAAVGDLTIDDPRP